jgi:GntR family transcriptional repressor for pyruvate dehydrogenase complex
VSIDLRTPAYKVLADKLRAQITSGHLRPGDRLPTEPQLCRSWGVSRSTVREALRLLASQHLIVTVRGVSGGSFVVHPSLSQLSDTLSTGVQLLQASAVVDLESLLEVRVRLEAPAAGLAALRRTECQLDAMRAALFDPVTADLDRKLAAHPAFHGAIAEASGNPLLVLLTRPLHTLANVRDLVEGLDDGFWACVDADHRAILAAITRRCPSEAEAASVTHIEHLRQAYTPIMEKVTAVVAI